MRVRNGCFIHSYLFSLGLSFFSRQFQPLRESHQPSSRHRALSGCVPLRPLRPLLPKILPLLRLNWATQWSRNPVRVTWRSWHPSDQQHLAYGAESTRRSKPVEFSILCKNIAHYVKSIKNEWWKTSYHVRWNWRGRAILARWVTSCEDPSVHRRRCERTLRVARCAPKGCIPGGAKLNRSLPMASEHGRPNTNKMNNGPRGECVKMPACVNHAQR